MEDFNKKVLDFNRNAIDFFIKNFPRDFFKEDEVQLILNGDGITVSYYFKSYRDTVESLKQLIVEKYSQFEKTQKNLILSWEFNSNCNYNEAELQVYIKQAEKKEPERLKDGVSVNDAKPQSVNLYDILDVLEAIEELLIVQNKLEKRAAIFCVGISIIYIVLTVLGWSAR